MDCVLDQVVKYVLVLNHLHAVLDQVVKYGKH